MDSDTTVYEDTAVLPISIDATTTETELTNYYILQWSDFNHRRVGPFTSEDRALAWARCYSPETQFHEWRMNTPLTYKEAVAPAAFNYIGSGKSEDVTQSDSVFFFVQSWFPHFQLHGPFETWNHAYDWGRIWQERNDDCLFWTTKALIGKTVNAPINIVEPQLGSTHRLCGLLQP